MYIDIYKQITTKMLKTVWDISNAEFVNHVQGSKNYSDLMRKCGYTNVGNKTTVQKRIKALGLSTSHFTIGGSNKNPSNGKTPLDEILVNGSTTSNSCLKQRLFDELKWEYKCGECGISTWNDKPLSLELDHINGINTDNRLTNLRLLCPNCHSQTPTFRAKNKASIRPRYCRDCDATISNQSHLGYCIQCMPAHRGHSIKNKLSLLDLESDLAELKTYEAVAQKYNLSENCIRKWFRQYNQEGLKHVPKADIDDQTESLDSDALAILALHI
jgi:Zn finger protein HypA/HybF involved in hydrogenase expression